MTQSLKLALADMQGQLFELSREKGLDSEKFIKAFMLSDIAADLDSEFNHMQWAGKEYIMERILDELKEDIIKGGVVFDSERLYWAGYTYRSWHYFTGESSKEIYKQASAKTMQVNYLNFHTMSVEMAVERLKELYKDKHKK